MKPTPRGRPLPPKTAARSTLTTRTSHSTVPKDLLDAFAKPPPTRPAARPPKPARPARGKVARIIDDEESSLLDLIDNLLAKGVMLNADLILALADVDLVYVRLSALLCAADRVLGPGAIPPELRSRERGPVSPKPRSRERGAIPPEPRSRERGPVPPKLRSSEGG
jgi:hypothetical protein